MKEVIAFLHGGKELKKQKLLVVTFFLNFIVVQ